MLGPVSRTVESQLISKMCRVKSVGVGTVVVDVEPGGAETDTHAGVDAPLQSVRTADFAGFHITENSIEPLPKYLDAIRSFPTPKSTKDIRSWFGLVNQLRATMHSLEISWKFLDRF